MFVRAGAAAAESAQSPEVIFAPDSPHGLVAMFAAFDGVGGGPGEPTAA